MSRFLTALLLCTYLASADSALVLEVKTDNVAFSPSTQFILPLSPGSANCTIAWGDGSSETVTSGGPKPKTYTTAGTKTIRITATGTGFPGLAFADGISSSVNISDARKLTKIANWGTVRWPTSMDYAFDGCTNLVITATDHATALTDQVTSFDYAWRNCSNLTSFPLIRTGTGDSFRSTWSGCTALTSFPAINMAQGVDLRETWKNCSALTSFPNLDLRNMLYGSECFLGATLPSATYSTLLTALAANNTNTSVNFHAGNSRYSPAGKTDRDVLTGSSRVWTITDAGLAPPVITSSLAVSRVNGTAFNYEITADNGPHTFSASPLPSGLSLSGAVISGTTPAIGSYSITLTATNGTASTDTKVLVLTSNNAAAPIISGSLTANGVVGQFFTYQITATAAGSTPTYTAIGLPGGLTCSTSGLISGNPTASGLFVVGLRATNPSGTGMADLQLTIATAGPGPAPTPGGPAAGGGCGAGGAASLLLALLAVASLRRRQASR